MKRTVTPQWGKAKNLGKIQIDYEPLPTSWFSGPHAAKLQTLAENSAHINGSSKFIARQLKAKLPRNDEEKDHDYYARTHSDAVRLFESGDYNLPGGYADLLPLIGTRKSAEKALIGQIKALRAALESLTLMPGMEASIEGTRAAIRIKKAELAALQSEAEDDDEEDEAE